jgi:hypothetical protein
LALDARWRKMRKDQIVQVGGMNAKPTAVVEWNHAVRHTGGRFEKDETKRGWETVNPLIQ